MLSFFEARTCVCQRKFEGRVEIKTRQYDRGLHLTSPSQDAASRRCLHRTGCKKTVDSRSFIFDKNKSSFCACAGEV